MEETIGYRSLLKHRGFTLNISANVINRIGDSIDMIAFSWMVYEISGSASWSALILAVNFLPTVFIQPFAGAFVERCKKKNVIIFCDLFRGLLTCLIAFLYMTHMLQPYMLLITTFLNNFFESIRLPADTAIVPFLVEKEEFSFAVSFTQTSSSLCELIGTAISGILITTMGIGFAIMIDAVSFFISAFLMSLIKIREQINKMQESSYFAVLKDGVSYLKGKPLLILLCVLAAILNGMFVPMNSFLSPYVSGILHQSAVLLSVIQTSFTIGITLGSVISPYLRQKCSIKMLVLTTGMLIGFYYFGMGQVSWLQNVCLIYGLLSAYSLIFGTSVGLLNTIAMILLMEYIDSSYLARMSAFIGSFGKVAMPLLSFIMSFLCLYVGVVQIFFGTGVVAIIIFIVISLLKIWDNV